MTRSVRQLRLLALLVAPLALSCAADRDRAVKQRYDTAFDYFTEGEKLEARGDYELALRKYEAAASMQLEDRPAFLYKIGHMHQQLGRPENAIIYYDRVLETAPDFEEAAAQRELARLEAKEHLIRDRTPVVPPKNIPGASPESASAPPAAITPRPAPPIVTASAPTPTPEPAPTPAATPTPAPTATPAPISKPVAVGPGPINIQRAPEPAAPAPTPDPTSTPAPTPVPVASVSAYDALDKASARKALFPELTASDEENRAAERRRAEEATKARRWTDAALGWRRVVENSPNDATAHLELAKAFHKTGRTLRAIEEFQAASNLTPDNGEIYLQWGNANRDGGDWDEAARLYTLGRAKDQNNMSLLNNLGALHLSRDNPRAALPLFRELVERQPDFAPAHLNLAEALEQTGAPASDIIAEVETYLRLGGERREEADNWLAKLRARGAAN